MTIVASVHQTVPLHADLPAAMPALAQIATRGPQPDQSSPINKTAFACGRHPKTLTEADISSPEQV
jgi:hypothetical protein